MESHKYVLFGSLPWVLLLSPVLCSRFALEESGAPPRTLLSYSQKFLWDSLCLCESHVISLRFPLTSASCLTQVRGDGRSGGHRKQQLRASAEPEAEWLRLWTCPVTSLCLPHMIMGITQLGFTQSSRS